MAKNGRTTTARRTDPKGATQDRAGLYQEITDTIIAELEAGTVP